MKSGAFKPGVTGTSALSIRFFQGSNRGFSACKRGSNQAAHIRIYHLENI